MSDLIREEGQHRAARRYQHPDVRIHLFGAPEIIAFGPVCLQAKSLETLARVVAEPDTVSREVVATDLWPETIHSRHSLSNELMKIRCVLGDEIVINEGREFLRFNRDSGYWVDLDAFESLYETGSRLIMLDTKHRFVKPFDLARHIARGDFLQGIYSDWCEKYREQIENQRMRILDELGKFYAQTGKLDMAADCWESLLKLDPFCPETIENLMLVYAVRGSLFAAHKVYREYFEMARCEGFPIVPEIEKLYVMVFSDLKGWAAYEQLQNRLGTCNTRRRDGIIRTG